jgi:hypothetical protein
MRRIALGSAISFVLVFLVQLPAAAVGHDFGEVPLDDVKSEAAGVTRCSGLTARELAAMVLAPTWPEVAGGDVTKTPSPMALGRNDVNSPLYSPFPNTRRAFFHSGVGMWQLDTGGLGTEMTAAEAVKADTAAHRVADTMASLYCSAGGSVQARRAQAFFPWHACDSGACESIYQDIYCASVDQLCHMDPNANVGRQGGMGKRTCYVHAGPVNPTFTCWYINVDNAQGYKGYWATATPLTGGTGTTPPSPLTHPFYNWATDNGYERRHWIEADTGYSGRGEVYVLRSLGSNPRSAGNLDWFDADTLCDVDFNRGTC